MRALSKDLNCFIFSLALSSKQHILISLWDEESLTWHFLFPVVFTGRLSVCAALCQRGSMMLGVLGSWFNREYSFKEVALKIPALTPIFTQSFPESTWPSFRPQIDFSSLLSPKSPLKCCKPAAGINHFGRVFAWWWASLVLLLWLLVSVGECLVSAYISDSVPSHNSTVYSFS